MCVINMKTDLFVYDDVLLPPDRQIGLHEQDTWELSYISVGSGMRLIGDKMMPFGGGEVVLIPPGVPHCWYFDGKQCDRAGHIANITLMFSQELLGRVANFPELSECVERVRNCKDAVAFTAPATAKIIALLKEMREMAQSERIGCVVRLLAVLGGENDYRVVGAYRNMDKAQKRMDRIRIYIICNYNKHISVSGIARFAGMNKSAFCVFFKKMTGKTFVRYLNEYRVELACRLLAKGEMTVAEICYSTGFGDVPYFHRTFKRITGTTPGSYNKKACQG